MSTVTAAIVAYNTPAADLDRVRDSVRAQTSPPERTIVVDNSPDARSRGEVVAAGSNLGYGGAANLALKASSSDYVLLLNPDVSLAPACVENLVAALEGEPGASVAGAQVLLADGRVNAGANPVHLSGLSWSGRYGEPPEDGVPRRVIGVSGAVMLLRREAVLELGGFCEPFFLYYEDVELGLRSNLAGQPVLFCPAARAEHAYEFGRTAEKLRLLERNRWFGLLTTFSPATLLRLAPLLAAVEAGIWAHAIAGGSARSKAASYRDLIRMRGEIRSWRAHVQRLRQVPDSALLATMTADVDTPLLRIPCRGAVNRVLRAYRRLLVGGPAAASLE